MSYVAGNAVRTDLASDVAAGAASIDVVKPSAPWQAPPDPGGDTAALTLINSPARITKIEVVHYTGYTDNGDGTVTLSGVTKDAEGVFGDQAWTSGEFVVQDLTAAVIANLLQADGDTLAGNLDADASHTLINLPDPTNPQEAATKAYADALKNGLSWQHSVIAEQNDPPGTPGDGDRYLVGPSPTGDWSGNGETVAEYDGGAAAWDFYAPAEGWAVNVEGSNLDGRSDVVMLFNGSGWVNFGSAVHHGSTQGLLDDDHTQYMHKDTARTVSAVHTLNPSTAGAPFTLGANAQGQHVSGLNSDQLDGNEAADLKAFSVAMGIAL